MRSGHGHSFHRLSTTRLQALKLCDTEQNKNMTSLHWPTKAFTVLM